jgi:hypothetical protein
MKTEEKEQRKAVIAEPLDLEDKLKTPVKEAPK